MLGHIEEKVCEVIHNVTLDPTDGLLLRRELDRHG